MSSPEYVNLPSYHLSHPQLTLPRSAAGPSIPQPDSAASSSSNRKNRIKKHASHTPTGVSTSRRARNKSKNPEEDTPMTGTDDNAKTSGSRPPPPPDESRYTGDNSEGDEGEDHDDPDDVDPDDLDPDDEVSMADVFGFGGPPPPGILAQLGGYSALMSGTSARLGQILKSLKNKGDPSVQLLALNELSQLLLISNEDNLQGNFQSEQFVRELTTLMKPDPITMEANMDIMLLACRCITSLMEALPSSVTTVVYSGAVPVLCDKLRGIEFIDLAEQALSALEKISVEFPAAIVKEGGLAACLQYLDWFHISVQRTAVTTAANCCRNLPHDHFDVVKAAMVILRDVLKNSDQKVVEQASICVSRIVDAWKSNTHKLEALVSEDLLSSILRLLVPGSANLVGPSIHTQFLKVLASTAKASPRLAVKLMQMDIVETLYQVLTGVSPPNGTEDVASKIDRVLIMQALVHRPRDQIIETLNVICELLPKLPPGAGDPTRNGFADVAPAEPAAGSSSSRKKTPDQKRIELLGGCKDNVRRFAMILFPTLTDAFSSTVNPTVRQKVLLAQLKMLYNLDVDMLKEALAPVPYASFLASILSLKDDCTLVLSALQATDVLTTRLSSVYQYQLHREGVIAQIAKLAEDTQADDQAVSIRSGMEESSRRPSAGSADSDDESSDGEGGDRPEIEDEDDDDEASHHSSDDEHDEDDEDNDLVDVRPRVISGTPGSGSSGGSTMSIDPPPPPPTELQKMRSRIYKAAKAFLEKLGLDKSGKTLKKKAAKILEDLSGLADAIEGVYLHPTSSPSVAGENGKMLFAKLATIHFDADMFESVTSYELLHSGVVRVLEQVFSNPDEDLARAAQAAFTEIFMGTHTKTESKTDSPSTPFSVMVHKLQDLLSRSEHFEVFTVTSNHPDGHRSSNSPASMLAKQIRLKLSADEDSEIPRMYRSIMVSIHAIATFKSLEDYLRPRISPRPPRNRETLNRALAAVAGGAYGMSPFGSGPSAGSAARLASRLSSSMGGAAPPPPGPPAPSSSRSARKTKSSNPAPDAPSTPEPASSASAAKVVLRRSSRRSAAAPQPPRDDENDLENALECADEKHLEDEDDDDDELDHSALDAIVGDLDEEMDDAPTPDPSAVNLEVADGGKITARKEDGTRVPTPSNSQGRGAVATPTPSGAGSGSNHMTSRALLQNLQNATRSSSSRPMSYAAAIQSTPQDWHLEFTHDGKVVSNDTTVYRAVHKQDTDDFTSRNVWSHVHEIKIRKVPGPPPPESGPFGSIANEESGSGGNAPASLAKYPTTVSILRLLKILHNLNANIDDVIMENKAALTLHIEPLTQFVNTKLTAKLNRQLEEPLIVASSCLPSWSEDLARLYPFLFPFETRHLFLQSTSFGYARSMNRWQNAQPQDDRRRHDDRPFLGRLQRQKVRISRDKILESALKVMDLYGSAQSILEVEYFEEVGTGLGPTLEFYSSVSKEFSTKKTKMWRDADHNDSDYYVSAPHGLFPRPYSEEEFSQQSGERILQLFRALGKFVARSMIDSRIIDVNLNPIFFRIGDDSQGIKPSLGAMNSVDPGLARSLVLVKRFALAKKEITEDPERNPLYKVKDIQSITVDDGIRLEDLSLDFTLPGYPEIELIPQGSQIMLSIDNVDEYLERVADMTLGSGVRRQVDAFQTGFSQVFPYSALKAFTPNELCNLFGRVEEDWSLPSKYPPTTMTDVCSVDANSFLQRSWTQSRLIMASPWITRASATWCSS